MGVAVIDRPCLRRMALAAARLILRTTPNLGKDTDAPSNVASPQPRFEYVCPQPSTEANGSCLSGRVLDAMRSLANQVPCAFSWAKLHTQVFSFTVDDYAPSPQ